MKNLKRFALLLLILAMVMPFVAQAQAQDLDVDIEPVSYSDAAGVFDETVFVLTSMVFEDNDEETAKTLSGLATYLMEMQMGFLYAADDGRDKDHFAETTPAEFEYHAEPEYIEEMDYVAGFDICRKEGYICIESEAFNKETEEQFDYLRFEVAQREDSNEIMVLFTLHDIDGLMTSSNRYLLYSDGDSTELLYSRTFGTVLTYRIDLQEWAKGTDYTWSKELLYPAA